LVVLSPALEVRRFRRRRHAALVTGGGLAVLADEMGAGQPPFGFEPVVARGSLVDNDAAGFAYGFQ